MFLKAAEDLFPISRLPGSHKLSDHVDNDLVKSDLFAWVTYVPSEFSL